VSARLSSCHAPPPLPKDSATSRLTSPLCLPRQLDWEDYSDSEEEDEGEGSEAESDGESAGSSVSFHSAKEVEAGAEVVKALEGLELKA
jgi:hypothetical protein